MAEGQVLPSCCPETSTSTVEVVNDVTPTITRMAVRLQQMKQHRFRLSHSIRNRADDVPLPFHYPTFHSIPFRLIFFVSDSALSFSFRPAVPLRFGMSRPGCLIDETMGNCAVDWPSERHSVYFYSLFFWFFPFTWFVSCPFLYLSGSGVLSYLRSRKEGIRRDGSCDGCRENIYILFFPLFL